MQELENRFSFPQELVDDALAFPNGSFVEVDNTLYEANNLGRKVMQTQTVRIGGKEVSVGTLGGDMATYELVVSSENPVNLGGFESIIDTHHDLFLALHRVFGDSVSTYQPIEMVIAIRAAVESGVSPSDADRLGRIAGEARSQVKRGSWIANNNVAAFAKAPVDWRSLGL